MTQLTNAAVNNATAFSTRSARFVTITFNDYTLRLWTGIGDKIVNGNTYSGVGGLGSIGPVSDKSDLSSQRLQMTLSGFDASLMADVRNYQHAGAPVEILEAQLDTDENIIPNAYDIFFGEIDTLSVSLDKTLTVSAVVENFLSFAFRGPDGRRRTSGDQIDLFAGDTFFEFAAQMLDDIPWGSKNRIAPTNAAGQRHGTVRYQFGAAGAAAVFFGV